MLYLILIGLFGAEALAQMKFPAVTMMSGVQITGGISEKDGCFYVQHLVLYAVCNAEQHGFYSGNLVAKVIRDCGGYLKGKKNADVSHSASSGVWRDSAVLQKSAVFGLRDIPAVEDWNTFCRWRADTVVSDRREKNIRKSACAGAGMFLFGCLFLQGCNVAELEDKAFPVL